VLKPLLIFIGAGSGGLLRYWIGGLVQSAWAAGGVGAGSGGSGFPLGTLFVNVSGCLVMGVLATAWYGPVAVRDELRALVLIGVLGGYTTFSTFGRETLALVHDEQWGHATLYILGSVILSLAGVWLGAAIARGVWGE
jgi:CrcB protein